MKHFLHPVFKNVFVSSGKRKKSHFHHLKNKWTQRHEEREKNLLEKHTDVFSSLIEHLPSKEKITAGSIGTFMLISNMLTNVATPSAAQKANMYHQVEKDTFLVTDLYSILPKEVRELRPEEEERISAILSSRFQIKVAPELEGIRLNRSYGYIGAEQHLARYPGDTMETHFTSSEDSAKYYSSGMAPGLGAWGYFAPSRSEMTEKDSEKEKYYIAVQTFLAPGFQENVRSRYAFFKHRKMLVVNPQNGHAMVVVIGDAGPAAWTGKHLGGSPEVMKYLERVDGRAKGPVLYFFIDDPDDTIPLGPIHVQ